MNIDLSIVIPVYNTEKFLKDCLDSVFIEIKDKSNVEVILVDDGSSDNSKDIYDTYNYSNLKKYKNDNHGVSFSRNYGIEKAQGKWIMFLDADDLLIKNWYNKMEETLQDNGDILCFSNILSSVKNDRKNIIENILGIRNEWRYFSFPGAKIFRRNFIEENNIRFKEGIINGEDMLFNISSVLKANNVKFINESIYLYRINPFSATKKFDKRIFESDLKFQKELVKILMENSVKNAKGYVTHTKKNAIYLFVYRLSFLENKELTHQCFEVFDEKEYKECINNESFKEFDTFKRIIVFLIKKKCYKLAINIIKLARKIQKILKSSNNKEYVLDLV